MVHFIILPYVYDLIQQKICVEVLRAFNHPASPGTDYRDKSGGPNRELTRTGPNLPLHKQRGGVRGGDDRRLMPPLHRMATFVPPLNDKKMARMLNGRLTPENPVSV